MNGGCTAFARAYEGQSPPACCDSCHDDADDGYGDLWDYTTDKGTFILCCSKAEWAREKELLRE